MAFDKKRLDTFKWLERISVLSLPGLKNCYNPYQNKLIMHYGRVYATNGYILACAEYPEFVPFGNEWEIVTRYKDNDNKLLKFPDLQDMYPHPTDNRFFDNMFFHPNGKDQRGDIRELLINPALVMEALKGFKLNHIAPNVIADATRIQFDGHNKDVSISVMVMGMR